jgi:hypothetical protein
MQIYELLDGIRDLLPAAQAAGLTRGLVLYRTSPHPTQTVALGGFLFTAASRDPGQRTTSLQTMAPCLFCGHPLGEFYVLGSGLTLSLARDPDVYSGIAGVESVEEVSRRSGEWKTERRLNGDQTNQGRQLLLDPHQQRIYRVRIYSVFPESGH